MADIERHEAFSDRTGGERTPPRARRSEHVEAGGSLSLVEQGRGWTAALTTTGRISTARWSGSGCWPGSRDQEAPAPSLLSLSCPGLGTGDSRHLSHPLGKVTEVAVMAVIKGEEVKNPEALANPEALEYLKNRSELAN